MKNKEILYDDIITEHNGELFKHGEVTYSEAYYPIEHAKIIFGTGEEKWLPLNVNLRFVIAENNRDEFIKSLTELVDKYAL